MSYNLPAGVFKYMKNRRGSLIPSETSSGQLGMFPSGAYTLPKPKGMTAGQLHRMVVRGAGASLGSTRGGGIPRPSTAVSPATRVRALARKQELLRKDSQAAVNQQFKMDEAQKAGQITDREIVKQNKILMRRRKRAGV